MEIDNPSAQNIIALYHASLAHKEYRQLLADNCFRVVKQVTEDPDCGGHTIWLAQREG